MLLAALIGAATGAVAILLHVLLGFAESFTRSAFTGWWIALAPALGGLLCGLWMYKVTKTPEAAGQGTDRMIYSFHHRGGNARPRIVPVKLVSSVITLGSGGSAGYEGPVSQIGSGIASTICNAFRMPRSVRRQFTLAGMAAGLGAIFKAPLSGALTSVEVLYREDFESGAFGTSIVAAVVGFTVYTSWVGSGAALPVPVFPFPTVTELLAYIVLGCFCTPFSFLYVKCYDWAENHFNKMHVPLYVKPAIGGLVAGGILLIYPEVFGGGWDAVVSAIGNIHSYTGTAALFLLGLAVAKIIATAFTVGSGGSGGVFGPSLFIGGAVGALFAGLIEGVCPGLLREPGAMVLVGMGAFFAGAAKAPIAGVVMVCEMTGSYSLLPGLLLAAVCHIALSRKWSIYRSQVKNKFASPVHRAEMDPDVLRVMTVSEVMVTGPVLRLDGCMELSEALKRADAFNAKVPHPRRMFPVYDGDKYEGLADMSLVHRYGAESEKFGPVALVSDCVVNVPLLRDSADLHSAINFLLSHGLSEVYVRDASGTLTGTLTYRTLLRAYDSATKQDEIPLADK